ncbi:antitoxin MazE family protein [Vibrio sp. J383]|nr:MULTISPECIES: antitoxin MazE-like protein [Vibrio]RPF07616.1 DUF3018 family protein [Vibrio crassostreae]UQV21280.1 antitoxin MazE family protein [Vibrio sp. J383]
MMSRNSKYEAAKKAQGLKKVTLWVPDNRESEFHMLAKACCEFRHLTFNTLRDTQSGKYISLERL